MMQLHRNAAMKPARAGRRKGGSNVVVVRVNRRVMKKALQLADGDARRLKIVDETTVVVR